MKVSSKYVCLFFVIFCMILYIMMHVVCSDSFVGWLVLGRTQRDGEKSFSNPICPMGSFESNLPPRPVNRI